MKGARTTYLLIAAFLLAGALALMGCGETVSPQREAAALSGLEPFVGASMLAEQKSAGTETTVGDVTQIRGMVVVFQVEASDARASGTLEVTNNYDASTAGATSWGSSVLTNDKGTWVCDAWNGAATVSQGDRSYIFEVAKGTGGYEGLTKYSQMYFTQAPSTMMAPSKGIAVSGWIQKSE